MRTRGPVKPLVGISCCTKQFGVFGMPNHAASDTYIRVTEQAVEAVPVLLPANGPSVDIETLLDRLDGIILTGSRSNVQPCLYGGPPHATGTPEDPARDAAVLPLIRAAIAAGVPVLAICRGFQELNVALGGSLHQRLQDLPGRLDHSTPMQRSAKVRQGKAHFVRVSPGGWLRRLAGADRDPRQFPAQSGGRAPGARAGGRGDCPGWHDRGGAGHQHGSRTGPGLRGRSAMASGIRLRGGRGFSPDLRGFRPGDPRPPRRAAR